MSETTLIKGKLLNSSVDFGAWSDIAPVLQSQVGIAISGVTGMRTGTYYNSASGYDQNIYCFAIFNQEPNIKQGSYESPEIVSATYDSTSGLWYYIWYFQGWNRLLNNPMGADIPFYSFDTNHMFDYFFTKQEPPAITSNGGGATHIAKVTGQLKDLSSNLSDILMISGGGGGGLLVGETDYPGEEAGGISGSGDNSADQSTGNAFGQGESGTDASGGGSGLYGGYKGTSSKSGGAGSGYIGNSLLSNKKMVGYNVPTSSAEGTKTESANEVSASAVSGKPKSGNGVAKIKFLRDLDVANMQEWIPDGAFGWQVTYDSETKENHITGQCNQFWEYYEFPLDVERNKNYTVSLQFKGSNYNYFALYDTLRVLDRWMDATQIQQEDGINYNYVIAESDTHFSNQSNYVDCSVTFNSGNRDKVWLYIGAGYVWTSTWMDLYFKNITVVKND